MGKGTDKLYITHSEWSGQLGDHSAGSSGTRVKRPTDSFARLPFDCCALSLKPFESPVATASGTVYELTNIIPYVRKHGTDPVSGAKLNSGDLIKLNFAKNSDGDYHDPLTFKPFTHHTPIVFIKTSGNVYSKDAVEQLNIKPGFWRDLISDQAFTRSDIITIQDPHDLSLRDFSKFEHVKNPQKNAPKDEESKEDDAEPSSVLTKQSSDSRKTAPISNKSEKPDKTNVTNRSSGATATALTSTIMTVSTTSDRIAMADEDFMFDQIRKRGEKAYLRIVTNYGPLNFEMFADRVPRTCYNFVTLAKQHYYDNTIFHRLIPNFMLQGGDPTGTGKGGTSCWGKQFADEFNVRNAPKHTERGTLSMANHGKDTNGSQFFITFRATPHLDSKHTVFGHLVGGEKTLDKIEKVKTEDDRPVNDVKLIDVAIFKDPFEEHMKREARRKERQTKGNNSGQNNGSGSADRLTWFGTKLDQSNNSKSTSASSLESVIKPQVGKYLNKSDSNSKKRIDDDISSTDIEPPNPKKRKPAGFGDFSSW